MKVLLVEPAYKNKYPPMGLMKISTYHKRRNDSVRFVKGFSAKVERESWDRIYVTSLFTFDFEITIDTILHYMRLIGSLDEFYVGGIMASLMPDRIMERTGLDRAHILTGLFTSSAAVGDNDCVNIDRLPLDYDILEDIDYKYPAGDNYFAYTTRGCPNHCSFCAVPLLEPEFQETNNIVDQIRSIDQHYGPKQNLLLLDNNVLNTSNLEKLVDDLCEAGFQRGAKFIAPGDYKIIMMRFHKGDRQTFLKRKLDAYLDNFTKRIKSEQQQEQYKEIVSTAKAIKDVEQYANYMLQCEEELSPIIEKYRSKVAKARYLDFNQGVDARKITDANMAQLSRLAIKPLRIAFDDIKLEKVYRSAVITACKHGINQISNYMLFNYKDRPEDLYKRLLVNIRLNEQLGIQIFSFPMKYSPIDQTDRKYIGVHWTKKALRAISAILQVNNGSVAAGPDFFYKAFGKSLEEYFEILAMPREFIMFRTEFEHNGKTAKWTNLYRKLTAQQKQELMNLTSRNLGELKEELQYGMIPEEFEEILPYYFLKSTKTSYASKRAVSNEKPKPSSGSDDESLHYYSTLL